MENGGLGDPPCAGVVTTQTVPACWRCSSKGQPSGRRPKNTPSAAVLPCSISGGSRQSERGQNEDKGGFALPLASQLCKVPIPVSRGIWAGTSAWLLLFPQFRGSKD